MDKICKKSYWHTTDECVDSDAVLAYQLRKMNSDLFQKHGVIPAAQNEIMNRNASTSPLLRLPPEIRLRIYKHVVGGQQLWMDFDDPLHNQFSLKHMGRALHHYKKIIDLDRKSDIRLLRVCRQIFTEAALLPYTQNEFVFESQLTWREFVKSMRPGKKLVVKKAIGPYKDLPLSTPYTISRTFMEKRCERSDEIEEIEESQYREESEYSEYNEE